jgi:hypothetical protein
MTGRGRGERHSHPAPSIDGFVLSPPAASIPLLSADTIDNVPALLRNTSVLESVVVPMIRFVAADWNATVVGASAANTALLLSPLADVEPFWLTIVVVAVPPMPLRW